LDFGLTDKRALVTGSTSGIGEAVARRLAGEHARVVVHGRNKERAEAIVDDIRAKGGNASFFLADLATPQGCDALGAYIQETLGGVDILVNNAGGSDDPSRTWATTKWEDWIEDFEFNAGSAVRMIQLLMPGMKKQGWGRIIQFASTGGTMPFAHTSPAYNSIKGGIITMTTSLSKTIARHGVTVNCITPGAIDTPVYRKFVTKLPPFKDKTIEEINTFLAKRWGVSTGYLGVPDDLAPAVAFLCSNQANWITGVNLRIDGGMSFFINT